MSAALAILGECLTRGIELRADDGKLRYRPKAQTPPDLVERLSAHKSELLQLLHDLKAADGLTAAAPLRGLLDGECPAAVLHYEELDRDLIIVRDEAALETLTATDRWWPVAFFAELAELARLPLEGLNAVLTFRQTFGPSAELVAVQRQEEFGP